MTRNFASSRAVHLRAKMREAVCAPQSVLSTPSSTGSGPLHAHVEYAVERQRMFIVGASEKSLLIQACWFPTGKAHKHARCFHAACLRSPEPPLVTASATAHGPMRSPSQQPKKWPSLWQHEAGGAEGCNGCHAVAD